MKTKFIAILLIAVLAFGIVFNSKGLRAQDSDEQGNVISGIRDLGWVTYASSDFSLHIENETEVEAGSEYGGLELYHRFRLWNEWSIEASGGASLPVNLTVIVPNNATPGDNITVYVGLFSEMGALFFNLLGEHYLRLENEFEMSQELTNYTSEYEFNLELLNQYLLNWSINLETPIGFVDMTIENITVRLGSFSLELEMEYEVNNVTEAEREIEIEANVDVYLNFDIAVIANTSVIGIVNVTGTATEPDEIPLVWTDEGWKEVLIPINDNATANDSLSVDVSLTYVVETFSIIYRDIDLIVFVNESSIEEEIEGFVNETQTAILLEERLEKMVDEYIMGEHGIPFNITRTELIGKQSYKGQENENNTIVSESPYEEFLAFYFETMIGIVSTPGGEEQPGGGITLPTLGGYEFTLIAVSALAAIVVATYAMVRRNRKSLDEF